MSNVRDLWALTLETKRLVLRPQRPDDYERWYEGFAKRWPAMNAYDSGWQEMSACTREWFVTLCEHHQKIAVEDKIYVLGIFSKQGKKHLGNVDISTICRQNNQWAVLGYGIHNHAWRQGFGKESVRAGLIAGFERLKYQRIEAHINLDNQASVALAKSVGMTEECIRRGFVYENKEWTDRRVYVARSSDFGVAAKVPSGEAICLRSGSEMT
ncbi:MAG: GNAT family N-acetyltransferase [Leptolyngbya foveolarum]|uniref:GNAT family N-acetyltransferase n=1 Tax=Leptolyngbya foveolarum TaxID=47253 RepID=A0A2W4U3W4_9CYAN|nr:MAG: GNAT family N-acetyltransferase [Leptolyngbya foveolarum]